MREAGADELGVDCRIMRESGAGDKICVVKLFSELMLEFEALDIVSDSPKIRRIVKLVLEGRNGFANGVSDCGRKWSVHVSKEQKYTGPSFSP